MTDYGDMCHEMRDERRERRASHGVDCPECVRLLPKANPSILLPGQTCKIHNYRATRKRGGRNE